VPISIRIHTNFVFTFLWYGNGNDGSMNCSDGSERSLKISMAAREESNGIEEISSLLYASLYIFANIYWNREKKINRKTSSIIPTGEESNNREKTPTC